MVKKVKRFIVFCLFSLLFTLLGGKAEKNKESGWNSSEAKCCPQGSVSLDRFGNCLNNSGRILDETCYL